MYRLGPNLFEEVPQLNLNLLSMIVEMRRNLGKSA